MDGVEIQSDPIAESVPTLPVKRKRGRPRKGEEVNKKNVTYGRNHYNSAIITASNNDAVLSNVLPDNYIKAVYALIGRQPGEKLTDVAKKCGLNVNTLVRYKRDPRFYQMYFQLCREEWTDNYGRVFQSLLLKCDEGDIQAIKLFMQIGGLAPVQNDDVPVHEQPKVMDVSKLTPEQRQVMYEIAKSQGLIAGQQRVEQGTGPDVGQSMDQDGPNLGLEGAQEGQVIDLEPIIEGGREDELEGGQDRFKPASKPGKKIAYELETSLFK